jgi:hypothetical protein
MKRDPGEIYRKLTPELSAPSGYPHSLAVLLALYLQGPCTYNVYLPWCT